MNNGEYWQKRFELLEQAAHQQGVQCYADIEKQYRQAQKQLDFLRVPFNVNTVFLLNLFKLFSLFLNKFFHLLFTFRCETASDNFQQFPDLCNSAF